MGIFNLTESEKKEILSLHNNAKVIKEQAETQQGAPTTQQAAPTTQQAAPTTQPLNPVDKIKLIQRTLIDKYGAKLGNTGAGDGVDGDLGPKTLSALANALKSKQSVESPLTEPIPQSTNVNNKIKPVVANTPLAANTTQIQQGTTTQQLTPKQIKQVRRAERRAERRAQQ